MPLPLRRPDELCTIYKLHPELRDLYVEGLEDVRFWRWLTKIRKLTNVGIYPADVIEPTTAAEVNNNKARIVTLATIVTRILGVDQKQATCVVDLDFDHIELRQIHLPCLFYTDATSLETEFYKPIYMEKFLGLVCRLDTDPLNFMGQTDTVLRQLTAFRLANERLALGLTSVPFEKDLELLRDLSIVFDRQSFINRYLQKNSKWEHRDSFLRVAEEAAAILPKECHKAAHGHDFVSLLGWFALKSVKEVCQNSEVKRWLYALANPEIVDEIPFCLILSRLT